MHLVRKTWRRDLQPLPYAGDFFCWYLPSEVINALQDFAEGLKLMLGSVSRHRDNRHHLRLFNETYFISLVCRNCRFCHRPE